MNRKTLWTAGLAVLIGSAVIALAEAPPAGETGTVGRYQLAVHASGWIYVLDTATGDCWSKGPPPGGEWHSEGNPTRIHREAAADEPLRLELPANSVELTIRQRQSKSIPGSQGRLSIHLGDITEGQVLLSVRADDGKLLRDDVSVRPEDVISFSVNGQRYFIRVKELRNILIGQGDFAVLEVSRHRSDTRNAEPSPPEPPEEPAAARTKTSPRAASPAS